MPINTKIKPPHDLTNNLRTYQDFLKPQVRKFKTDSWPKLTTQNLKILNILLKSEFEIVTTGKKRNFSWNVLILILRCRPVAARSGSLYFAHRTIITNTLKQYTTKQIQKSCFVEPSQWEIKELRPSTLLSRSSGGLGFKFTKCKVRLFNDPQESSNF